MYPLAPFCRAGGGVGHDFHATQKLCRMGMYMAQRGS
jgi:hypothetical protein